jgi:hypothetical protein
MRKEKRRGESVGRRRRMAARSAESDGGCGSFLRREMKVRD